MPHSVIIGLGQTGLSCARFLQKKGVSFAVADTRFKPPMLEAFETEFPDADIWLGPLDTEQLCEVQELVVSPGIAISEPAITEAMHHGISVIGDIELFAREAQAPIIAITGSNAKSTVTSLVGLMAEKAGLEVGVGGNIGLAALDLLEQGEKQLYILELSSFQLETTHSLKANVAAILNISPDHMDRYPDLLEYGLAKQRIYAGCNYAIANRADDATLPVHGYKKDLVSFGLDQPEQGQFGLLSEAGEEYLALGREKLIAVSDISLTGKHGQENALAALALGQSAGLPLSAMLRALQEFNGLPHRCQPVAEIAGVQFINDSKGTNVGATVAALNGLGASQDGRIILIAGGDGKGAEFSELTGPLQEYASAVVLIGRDACLIEDVVPENVQTAQAESMMDAVSTAQTLAHEGDIVLLSPACASFDMFASYVARGDAFVSSVQELGRVG